MPYHFGDLTRDPNNIGNYPCDGVLLSLQRYTKNREAPVVLHGSLRKEGTLI